jgi:hypothetical protein
VIQEDQAQPTQTQDQGEENVYRPFVQYVGPPGPTTKKNNKDNNEDNYIRIIAGYGVERLRPGGHPGLYGNSNHADHSGLTSD